MSKDNKSTKLFVANLSSKIRESDLEEKFDKFGKIAEVKVREGRDREKFAFIEFENTKDAEEAYEKMTGQELNGRKLRIEFARGEKKRDDRRDNRDRDRNRRRRSGSRSRSRSGSKSRRRRNSRRSRSNDRNNKRGDRDRRRRSKEKERSRSRSKDQKKNKRQSKSKSKSKSPSRDASKEKKESSPAPSE